MTIEAYFGVSILLFLVLLLELKPRHIQSMAQTTNMTVKSAYAYIIMIIAIISCFWLPAGVFLIVSRTIRLLTGKDKEEA